jgi:hypothetical protein
MNTARNASRRAAYTAWGPVAAERLAEFRRMAVHPAIRCKAIPGVGEYWTVHLLGYSGFDFRWMVDGDVHFVEMHASRDARSAPCIRVRRAARSEWNLVFEVVVGESEIGRHTVVRTLRRLADLLPSLPPLPTGGPHVVLWTAEPEASRPSPRARTRLARRVKQ